jgi:hypothetical protein
MPGRLEFDMGEKPIPVIKGTDYAKEFERRKRLEAARTDKTGPYSSLFDWKKEEGDLSAMQEKRQATQKKIMRTNALGEALRLLVETVGASSGATITKRQPNASILSAVNQYAQNEQDYFNRLEGVKAKKLAFSQADLQYELQQDALTLAKAEKREAESRAESRQAEKEIDTYIRELRLQENQYRLQGRNAEAEDARKKLQLAEQAYLEVEVARKKAQFERGIDLVPGQGAGVGVDILTKPKKASDAMQFITPDTGQTIYLTPGLVNYIATQLSVGKGPYDQTVPKVLRDIMDNKNPQPEALAKAFTDSWDYIRDEILAPVPELAAQLKIAPQAEEKVTKNTTPKLDADTGDIDENTKVQLYTRAYEILDSTSTQKNEQKADKEKLQKLITLIMSTYNAAGYEMSNNEAFPLAQSLMQQWRQNKTGADSTSVK